MPRKSIKKAGKISAYTVGALLLLLLVVFFGIRIRAVQNLLVPLVNDQLTQLTGSHVEVGSVYLGFRFSLDPTDIQEVQLVDVLIEDHHQDTLLYAGQLEGNVDLLDLAQSRFSIKHAGLKDAELHLRHYAGEDFLNINVLLDSLAGSDTTDSNALGLEIGEIYLENFRLRLEDDNAAVLRGSGVDFANLDVRNLDLQVEDFQLEADTIRAQLEHLSFLERSGLGVAELSGAVTVSPKGISVAGLELRTERTDVQTDLVITHADYEAYADFLNKVRFKCAFEKARIDLADLAYFVEDLENVDLALDLSGKISGKVSSLKAKDLEIGLANETVLRGDFRLNGLPELEETFINVELEELRTAAADLDKLVHQPFLKREINLPKELALLGPIRFRGNFTGFISDFVAYGEFNSDLGSVFSDIQLRQSEETDRATFHGDLRSTNFNLGRLTSSDSTLGLVSLNTEVTGSFKDKDVEADLKGTIDRFDLMGYSFQQAQINGKLATKTFEGTLNLNDPNIGLMFNGKVDLNQELPVFAFAASVDSADLRALNLVQGEYPVVFSTRIQSDFRGNNIRDAQGQIIIRDLSYSTGREEMDMDSLRLTAENTGTGRKLQLNSDFVDGTLTGKFNTNDLLRSVRETMAQFVPAYFEGEVLPPENPEDFSLTAQLHNTQEVTAVFLPDLRMDSTVNIRWSHSSIDHTIGLKLDAGRVIYGRTLVEGLDLKFDADSSNGRCKLDVVHLDMGESLPFNDLHLKADMDSNRVDFDLGWLNGAEQPHRSQVAAVLGILGDHRFEAEINPSVVYLGDSLWQIAGKSKIAIDTTAIAIQNLRVGNESRYLLLDGKLSEDPTDSLDVALSHFDLTYLNVFLQDAGFTLTGFVDGEATISDPYHQLLIDSDIGINELEVNGYPMGTGRIRSDWSNLTKALRVDGALIHEQLKTMLISGYYYPARDSSNLDLKLGINAIELGMMTPLVEGYLSNLDGQLYGRLKIQGEPTKPVLSGGFKLQDASLLVDYLNTTYKIDNETIRVEQDWFGFDLITLEDEKGKKAQAIGTVFHDNYQNLNFDINLNVKEFNFLNTNLSHNSLFYGKAFFTGDINVDGYAETLNIDITGRTEKGTKLSLPLSESEEVSESSFITFVDRKNPRKEEEEYEVDLSGVQMNFDLELTEDAQLEIIFDQTVGDIIKANGNGNLQLEINTLGEFNIYGEYVLNEGDYLFTLQNIINKRFNIERGGSIVFNGSPYSAQMDVNAIYMVRTSPADLGTLVDSNNTRKVPVNVSLNMAGNMLNPDIRFGVEMPTLGDNDAANLILSGMSEQELNQQVFSLLIIRRFVSTDGALHGGSAGASSSSEVLSNQLTNWLSQISRDVDLGVNYSPGDEVTTDEVELMVSTQLFNDRVSIETNLGVGGNQNTQSGGQQTQNNVVGDFNIEYKVNQEGTVRTSVFNKSNDNNLANFNNAPYTQGVGLFYRKEFHRFGDLFRRWFGGKEDKKEKKEKD